MKRPSLLIGMLAVLAAPSASAQSINLTGIYTCVDKCQGGFPAHVTQNGYSFNLLTEAGVPAHGRTGFRRRAGSGLMPSTKARFIHRMACSFNSTMEPSGIEACRHLGAGRSQRQPNCSNRAPVLAPEPISLGSRYALSRQRDEEIEEHATCRDA